MNYIRHLNAFFNQVRKDERLSALHVSLYLALFQYWNYNRFQNPFPVYRDNIMQLSRIGSRNTYHKCIKFLHQAGYIIYHPALSKYKPVKISIIRLDMKEKPGEYHQLNLFSPPADSLPTQVPELTSASPKNDPPQVPKLGQSVKHLNIFKNNVSNPPTKNSKNQLLEQPKPYTPQVPNLRPIPTTSKDLPLANPFPSPSLPPPCTLAEVEAFFHQNHQPLVEAHKFYYYNQAKSWILTGKTPISDWRAIAQKWILNIHTEVKEEQPLDWEKEIQYLNEKYRAGEKIAHYIRQEHFNHLKLQLTPNYIQEAIFRRKNQLTGSNQNADIKLLQSYETLNSNDPLLLHDQKNLHLIAMRLAVLAHFESMK